MVNLFTTYFNSGEVQRQDELNESLLNNIRNHGISKIYIFDESGDLNNDNKQVCVSVIDGRPTFAEIFNWVNEVTGNDDINIVANSDIYFEPDAITLMEAFLKPGDCWALTRWDVRSDRMIRQGGFMVKDAEFMNRRDSQDSFCFRGKIKPMTAGFCQGQPGCDNRICHEIAQAGYRVSNPSWSVKTYHLHKNTYRAWHGKEQVPPPYMLIEPTTI